MRRGFPLLDGFAVTSIGHKSQRSDERHVCRLVGGGFIALMASPDWSGSEPRVTDSDPRGTFSKQWKWRKYP